MPKLKLLILDAGAVIQLHKLRLWEALIDKFEVHLSEIVAEKEVLFEPSDDGSYGDDIDLSSVINSGQVSVFAVPVLQIKAFRDLFDDLYLGDLDDGEAESLAYLMEQSTEWLISSGDAIVFRVLGNLNRSDQGRSLEELLNSIGLGRKLAWPYSKAFREMYTKSGQEDLVRGRGRKKQ